MMAPSTLTCLHLRRKRASLLQRKTITTKTVQLGVGLWFALQLLGGDSFGDPTELLPYLGPGGGSGTAAAADPLMADCKPTSGHGDDIMSLFS